MSMKGPRGQKVYKIINIQCIYTVVVLQRINTNGNAAQLDNYNTIFVKLVYHIKAVNNCTVYISHSASVNFSLLKTEL
jgi:hypothetical protein